MTALQSPQILRFPTLQPPAEPKPAPTLSEIYREHHRPGLELRAKKTVEAYDDAIKHWQRYTGDPPADQITAAMLRGFQIDLSKRSNGRSSKPISPETVDKTLRHLKPIVSLCMPADRSCPEGLGLVKYLKYPKPIAKHDRPPVRFNLEELDRIYGACEVATWPRREKVPAPLQWRAAVVGLYNLGPRVYDLFARRWSDIVWTWQDDEGRTLHPFGSIQFTATKTGKLQRIPFHPVVDAHFRALQTHGRPTLFAGNWQPTNRKTINNQWARILEAAGITPHKPLKWFRATANNAYNRIRPGTGSWILGHRPNAGDVNAANYVDPTDIVFEAVLAMPQPPIFLRGLASDLADRSPRLMR